MSLMSVKNSLGSRKPLLCDVCRNLPFNRLIKGQKMIHRIFKELPSTLSHCILCKLIFQTMKRLIIRSYVPEIEVSKYLEELGPSKLRLGFQLSEEGHGEIHIDVMPSIMIDGWLPFGSQNTLRLFRQQGEPHMTSVQRHFLGVSSRNIYRDTCPSIARLKDVSDSVPYQETLLSKPLLYPQAGSLNQRQTQRT